MKKKILLGLCFLAIVIVFIYQFLGKSDYQSIYTEKLPHIIIPEDNSNIDSSEADSQGGVLEIKEETMDFQPLWSINQEDVAFWKDTDFWLLQSR